MHPCSLRKKLPHKCAHSDLEAFWLWPLQPACSQNRAGSYVPDLTSHIQYWAGSHVPHLTSHIQYWAGSYVPDLTSHIQYWAGSYVPDLTSHIQYWAGSHVPDLTSHIQYCSILPEKARIILCETDPNPIWMAWSHFDQMHLVQKQASVQESSGPLAEHNWSATTFPLSGTQSHSSTDGPSYCAKSAQIRLVSV